MSNCAPCMPCTNCPDAKINWGIGAGCCDPRRDGIVDGVVCCDVKLLLVNKPGELSPQTDDCELLGVVAVIFRH